MADVAWEMTHSAETDASLDFAWKYWIDVANWDDPPAKFELSEPFVAGSRGVTHIPGQKPLHWFIRDCNARSSASIEIPLQGATLSFEWRFDSLAEARTLITQRVVLRGDRADLYLSAVNSNFSSNLPEGVRKMAGAIAKAAGSQNSPQL